MKTILVPTDFSKLSKVGVTYAISLAKEMDASVILLSVINASASSNTLMNWKKFEKEMVKIAQQEADKLLDEIKSQGDTVDISYRSLLGFPIADMIDQFAVKNKVDLIVMGSKGATGLKKVFLGSNATAVIDTSHVPLIVVPGEADFKQMKKLVYATDMQNLQKEIGIVARFASLFDAHIHVLHVIQGESSKKSGEKLERERFQISNEAALISKSQYPKIHLHVLENKNVANAVDKFVQDQKADLLAMFTHRLDFYEKFFGKSVTRQFAFHGKVPLLTFNKTNYCAMPCRQE